MIRLISGKICLLMCLVFADVVTATGPPITAVRFAPDGKSVVAASQAGLHVFSWPGLKRQRTIKTAAPNLHCIAFSPNGKQLAVGGGNPSEDGSVEIFSWPAAKSLVTFQGHDDSVRSIGWQNNTQLFSASIDRQIKLWNLGKKDKAILTLKGHSRSVDTICLLKEGKTLVSAGIDQSLRVWDLPSGKLRRSLSQHTKPVHALALRPAEDGLPMVASAASDRTIRFWQPTIGRMVRYIRLDVEPLDIAWLRNGSQVVAACVDGHIRVIDADEVKVTQTLPAINGWAYTLAVHPADGNIVVAGADGQIQRIELKSE